MSDRSNGWRQPLPQPLGPCLVARRRPAEIRQKAPGRRDSAPGSLPDHVRIALISVALQEMHGSHSRLRLANPSEQQDNSAESHRKTASCETCGARVKHTMKQETYRMPESSGVPRREHGRGFSGMRQGVDTPMDKVQNRFSEKGAKANFGAYTLNLPKSLDTAPILSHIACQQGGDSMTQKAPGRSHRQGDHRR